VDQLYVRWKKHINNDMAVFMMRYLGQVYIDMPTVTPEKEYNSVAAKRYKEARGKIFRFESSVPTLVQLPRYSLRRFKRNNSTCLAVAASCVDSTSLSEDEEEDDGMVFQDDDDDVDVEVTDTTSTLASTSSVSAPPGGRFLTAPTYAPPPGKTTGTKKAKTMLAAARASNKKKSPCTPSPSISVFCCCRTSCKIGHQVSERKSEIAKLAGTTQDQLRLDEDELKLEEVKLKLEEVNTYIRLGMREEAASSMAAFSAVKRSLTEGRVVVEGSQDDVVEVVEPRTTYQEESLGHDKEDAGGASVNLLNNPEEENDTEEVKATVFLEEDSSSSSFSLSSFRFQKKKKNKEDSNNNIPVAPGSVVVETATPPSVLFPGGVSASLR
jgi:hypothetical protein